MQESLEDSTTREARMTRTPIEAGIRGCTTNTNVPAHATINTDFDRVVQKLQRSMLDFGYQEFRSFQCEAMMSLACGKDVCLVLPTGKGKSLVYQLPSVVFDLVSVVVTPLLSLARNQVSQVIDRFETEAVVWSSETSAEKKDAIVKDITCEHGNIRLLFTTPESFGNVRLLEALRFASDMGRLFCVAVDEAHVCYPWGHEFRPPYLRLHEVRRRLGQAVPWIALTATANDHDRQTICETLHLQNPDIYVSSFNRPEIELNVVHKELLLLKEEREQEQGDGRRPEHGNGDSMEEDDLLSPEEGDDPTVRDMIQMIQVSPEACGIIYCRLRGTCDRIARLLEKADVTTVGVYHAGLSASLRSKNQRGWEEGDIRVMVATIAFGLGINKQDVRWVFHYDPPADISSYYQEVGRAGRDGAFAKAVMYCSFAEMEVNLKKEKLKGGAVDLAAMIYGETCRRKCIMEHFGEKGKTCKEIGGDQELCDVCRAPQQTMQALQRVQDIVQTSIRQTACGERGNRPNVESCRKVRKSLVMTAAVPQQEPVTATCTPHVPGLKSASVVKSYFVRPAKKRYV